MKYRVKRDCFHAGGRYRKGQVVEFDGKPSAHFVPLTAGEPDDTPTGEKKAIHKGNGKWAVIGPEGEELDSGLGKLEAQALASE